MPHSVENAFDRREFVELSDNNSCVHATQIGEVYCESKVSLARLIKCRNSARKVCQMIYFVATKLGISRFKPRSKLHGTPCTILPASRLLYREAVSGGASTVAFHVHRQRRQNLKAQKTISLPTNLKGRASPESPRKLVNAAAQNSLLTSLVSHLLTFNEIV